MDPAWDWLPIGIWSDVDEFKADLGSALCHRFLTDDMDGLAAAYLKQGDGWWAPARETHGSLPNGWTQIPRRHRQRHTQLNETGRKEYPWKTVS